LPAFILTSTNTAGGGSLLVQTNSRRVVDKFKWEIEVIGSVEKAKPSIKDGNGDPIRLWTSLIIPIVIEIPNLGPPIFKSSVKDLRVKVGEV
jgi:hypothetical protein